MAKIEKRSAHWRTTKSSFQLKLSVIKTRCSELERSAMEVLSMVQTVSDQLDGAVSEDPPTYQRGKDPLLHRKGG